MCYRNPSELHCISCVMNQILHNNLCYHRCVDGSCNNGYCITLSNLPFDYDCISCNEGIEPVNPVDGI